MEGWVPMHGELRVLDRAYRLESSRWFWRAGGEGWLLEPSQPSVMQVLVGRPGKESEVILPEAVPG